MTTTPLSHRLLLAATVGTVALIAASTASAGTATSSGCGKKLDPRNSFTLSCARLVGPDVFTAGAPTKVTLAYRTRRVVKNVTLTIFSTERSDASHPAYRHTFNLVKPGQVVTGTAVLTVPWASHASPAGTQSGIRVNAWVTVKNSGLQIITLGAVLNEFSS